MNDSTPAAEKPQAWTGGWSSAMDAAYPTMAHVYQAALDESARYEDLRLYEWLKANPPV